MDINIISWNKMQTVNDPETYETSEIVEKSSKTGVFSNKRLLVIQKGFLYYFTNVPKNYKTHVPNILMVVKELPKSSIEIKAINMIKMQSSNSPNLIIKFYGKDMIEREDIRKSISDRNYRHTKKITSDQEQWKFTFPSVKQSRTWYTALIRLKSHFSRQEAKQEDKIQEFFGNFDPGRRNSQLPPAMKDKIQPSQQKSRSMTDPAMDLVNKFIQDDKKIGNKAQELRPETLKRSMPPLPSPPKPMKLPTQSPTQLQLPIQSDSNTNHKKPDMKKKPAYEQKNQDIFQSVFRQSKLQIINEDEQNHSQKIEQQLRKQIQEQIRQQEKKKAQKMINQIKKQMNEKTDLIKNLQKTIKAMQESEKEKKRQLQQKEEELKIKKLQIQTHEKEKQYERIIDRRILQDKYNESNPRSIELHQFCVQTDEEDNIMNEEYSLSMHKIKNHSFIEDFSSTQRETLSWMKNAGSFDFQIQEKDRTYDHYDYYTEIGRMHSSELSFQDKVKRQLKMLNYISKMKNIAVETLKQYIDCEKPRKTCNFRGTVFEISIACSSGKIVNLEGKQKLVYSNKQHQKLKRQFKVYNHLQDKFINMSKTKKKFPLRVPLVFLIEYKGYTALLKYIPYLKQLPNGEEDFIKIQKNMSKIVEEENLDKFQYSLIGNRSDLLYMVTVLYPYKVTSETKRLQPSSHSLYSPQYLRKFRNANISINSVQLEEERNTLEKLKFSAKSLVEERRKISSLNQAIFCRKLKNLYRSTEPFVIEDSDERSSEFLIGFLSSPDEILGLVSDGLNIPINGLLINHLSFFMGLRTISQFDIYTTPLNNIKAQFQPVTRSFSLNSMYPKKLQTNLGKYIDSNKHELVQVSFRILDQIEGNILQSEYEIKFLRAKYELSKSPLHDFQTTKKVIGILEFLKENLQKHDWLQFRCSMLLIQCFSRLERYSQALKIINNTIQYVQYMFGEQLKEGQIQDYLYLLVAETLSKMGNHAASMQVYQRLLKNPNSSLTQQQIFMSIATTFAQTSRIQPQAIIQFLLSMLKDPSNLTSSRVGGKVCSQWQANIRQFIGSFYQQISNIDQSIRYSEQALQFYIESGVNDQQGLKNLLDICATLLKAYNHHIPSQGQRIFKIFKQILKDASFNDHLSLIVKVINFKFVTLCFCQAVLRLSLQEKRVLAQVLQQLRDMDSMNDLMEWRDSSEDVNLQDVERTVKKLGNRQILQKKQIYVVGQCNIGQISIFTASLG